MLMEPAPSDTLAMDMDGRRAGHFRRLRSRFRGTAETLGRA